jgi:hypothetical protein
VALSIWAVSFRMRAAAVTLYGWCHFACGLRQSLYLYGWCQFTCELRLLPYIYRDGLAPPASCETETSVSQVTVPSILPTKAPCPTQTVSPD